MGKRRGEKEREREVTGREEGEETGRERRTGTGRERTVGGRGEGLEDDNVFVQSDGRNRCVRGESASVSAREGGRKRGVWVSMMNAGGCTPPHHPSPRPL